MSERVAIGVIRRARGLRGELVVESLTDLPDRFNQLKQVYLVIGSETRRVTITDVRSSPKNEVLIMLADVTDRDAALALRGATLEIDLAERPTLPEGTYYYDELEGLDVYDTGDQYVGVLSRVFPRGGQDLYVVVTDRGEVLIPATEAIVKEIDLAKARMIIDPPVGLLDPDDAR